MDINQLLNAAFELNTEIHISLNITFPIILSALGAFHLRNKVRDKRTKDKAAKFEVDNNNTAHLQIQTKDEAACPEIDTKDKSNAKHRS